MAYGDDQTAMNHQAASDRSVLDPILDGELAMDDETLRALETDVRLATHRRDLALLAAATAHDVRAPLHSVGLYLELLRRTLTESPGPDRQERQERYFGVVSSELQLLEKMLDNLIDQMRLGQERVQRLDLAATVKDVLGFLEPQRRRIRIEIQSDAPPDPVFVDIQQDAIRHALTHLLLVAVDSTPEGETLRVQLTPRDGRAVIEIAGPGLAAPLRQDPEEEDGVLALTHRARGLAAARRVVEQHRGTLTLRSGASRAATLEIELPLSAAEEDRSHARSADR
jgi:signal transduction histidine kinase